jgi:hypothetical protein
MGIESNLAETGFDQAFDPKARDLVDPNRKVMVKRCGCPTGNPSAAVRRAAPGYHYTRDHLLSL